MVTAEGCSRRRKRLWDAVDAACDLIVVTSPESMAYLAGYAPSPFSFRTNEAAATLILTRERSILVGDNLLEPYLAASHVDERVVHHWYTGRQEARPRRNAQIARARDIIGSFQARTVGADACVPCSLFPAVAAATPPQVLDLEPHLLELRRSKDADEVSTLRQAEAAGEAGMAAGRAAALAGASELDVFHSVEAACRAKVGRPVLVYGDFAAGRRAAGANTEASRDGLRSGDLLILDFSVVIQGYRSDFASTVCVGKPTLAQTQTHTACAEALLAAEALLKPGTECRAIDHAARTVYASRGFDHVRPGHTGHGLGLGHPEPPFLVPESRESLVPGDVVTLEPCLFPETHPGGVRIERNYLITVSGFELLSRHDLSLEA